MGSFHPSCAAKTWRQTATIPTALRRMTCLTFWTWCNRPFIKNSDLANVSHCEIINGWSKIFVGGTGRVYSNQNPGSVSGEDVLGLPAQRETFNDNGGIFALEDWWGPGSFDCEVSLVGREVAVFGDFAAPTSAAPGC